MVKVWKSATNFSNMLIETVNDFDLYLNVKIIYVGRKKSQN